MDEIKIRRVLSNEVENISRTRGGGGSYKKVFVKRKSYENRKYFMNAKKKKEIFPT